MSGTTRLWGAILCGVGLGLALPSAHCFASEAPGVEFFERNIRPLLADKCYPCHSAESGKSKGDLLLDTAQGVLKGGSTGPAIIPGKPEESLLVKAIHRTDPDLQMPPKKELAKAEIALLEKWILMGAPDPRLGAKPVSAYTVDWDKAKSFWSFQPLKSVTVPQPVWPKLAANPIDHFVQAKLSANGLKPSPVAEKRALLRRIAYTLTGLPPTVAEAEAFAKDTSPNAVDKVVERLLATQQYGEQWGRHWLDLVRYADTSGCNSDFPVPTAYKYRNYVIKSLGEDKPYDQFVREQLAGDLLPVANDEQKAEHVIATGYLAISRRFGSRANEFHLTLEDVIDNMGKTYLGLSLGCARCHDHKFDPVSTKDYYALYGILNSTRFAFPGTEIYKHPKDFVALGKPEEAEEYQKRVSELAQLDDKLESLTQERKAAERAAKLLASTGTAAETSTSSAPKPESKPTRSLEAVKADLDDTKTRLRQLERETVRVKLAYAVVDGKPAAAKIQKKGDPGILGDEVPRGFLTILGGQRVPETESGSGRLELANWITSRENPLFARVMVNRVWQHHFGRGLVASPNDFGARGEAPSHPELLDWLTQKFVDSGYSLKSLHRLILSSHTWQQAVAAPVDADPPNQWLSHANPRRLTAEEVRDSILAVAGKLDRSMGEGHPFPPEVDWKFTQHEPFVAVYDTPRRSVYLMQQRIRKQPFLEVFDGADPNVTTPQRAGTASPIQALYFMNSAFVSEQSDALAVRIGLAKAENAARVRYAYELIYGRPARSEEIRSGTEYLLSVEKELVRSGVEPDSVTRKALASYTKALLGANEFFYLD